VALVAVLALPSFKWIYGSDLAAGPPIRSDGIGYYIYLPAVLLEGDVTLERTAARSFDEGREWQMQGVRRVPPWNRYLDKYPVGEAILLSPFFALGHMAAVITGAERDGFSTPYQVAAAAGGLVFTLLGVAVLGFFLRRWFSTPTVVLTLLGVVFGTNLFHYATYDAVFSHAFSFFLVATTLALSVSISERPRLLTAVALGFAAGLVTAVRPTDAVVVVFVALVGVTRASDVLTRLRRLPSHLPLLATGAGAFLLPLVPQIAYWDTITGKWFVYAYGDERLNLLHPYLLETLFSVRKGLFFWSPLLLIAVAGLPSLRRIVPGLLVPSLAYLAVSTWVIASWETWWYGGSLGQRPFVESLPVFALGLASLIETVRRRVARSALLATAALCSLLAVHAMVAYWLHAIPYDQTTWETYLHSFHRLYL
jgi:hypothetical protein